MGRSGIATLVAAALATVVLPATAASATARAAEPEIVSIQLTPQVDVSQGWGDATVAVHVRHAVGLPDAMFPTSSDNTQMVTAGAGRSFPRAGMIAWPRLDRVSGTATDGVWQATVRLSPAWNGGYPVTQVQITDLEGEAFYLPVTDGPVVTVSGGEIWSVVSVRNPIKIVTGTERWRPQAQVTNTVSGNAVGGARVRPGGIFDNFPAQSQVTGDPGAAADAAGLWTSPVTYGVHDRLEGLNYVYGGRGGRGWSLQGIGCDDITVKLQASSTYSDTTLTGDQPLEVTGNVWPAPAIFPTGAQVLLQHNLGAAGWQTLTTANVRHSGRYTLTWLPVQPGTYELRVRVPGNGGAPCTTGTVGTTLPTTTVVAQ